MPELLKKSGENILAASLLIKNELYASSVHCSYYSCFQKLKTIISQAYKCDYDDLEEELRNLNNSLPPYKRYGSHEFFINYKLNHLIRREEKGHKLISEINDIKLKRIKSDYQNIQIKPDEADSVLSKSKTVIQELATLL